VEVQLHIFLTSALEEGDCILNRVNDDFSAVYVWNTEISAMEHQSVICKENLNL
jgi:hypothetical protein